MKHTPLTEDEAILLYNFVINNKKTFGESINKWLTENLRFERVEVTDEMTKEFRDRFFKTPEDGPNLWKTTLRAFLDRYVNTPQKHEPVPPSPDTQQPVGTSEADALRQELAAANAKVAELVEKAAILQSQVDNADVNLEQAKLNYEHKLKSAPARLLPITPKMPGVAEGCVRVSAWHREKDVWFIGNAEDSRDTHYIDIQLPPTPQPDPLEQERREFEEWFYSTPMANRKPVAAEDAEDECWLAWQARAARGIKT